jgi:hypothetical protein
VGEIVRLGMLGSGIIADLRLPGGRDRAQFQSACREHAPRLARAIIRQQGAGDQQEV